MSTENRAEIPTDAPWYKQGLWFSCTGCGKCCSGAPGYVWIDEEERTSIAAYLGLTLSEFMHNYVRRDQKHGKRPQRRVKGSKKMPPSTPAKQSKKSC